jgi:arylsulfatase A-like enzyme
LLTGQYCSRSASLQKQHPVSGIANVFFNTEILPGQWQLAAGMKAAGYRTGILGKWHLHPAERDREFTVYPPIPETEGKEYRPQDLALPEHAGRIKEAYRNVVNYLHEEVGWDYVSGIHIKNGFALGIPRSMMKHEGNMEWYTAGVLRFLEEQKDNEQPFFLYFAPNIPHGGAGERFAETDPHVTPEGYVDWHMGVQPSREDVMRRVRESGADNRLAWATWMDDGIGIILDKLDELGMAENTIVMLTSDQQSDGKWTCYQGARVPLTVRWPGKVKPGSIDHTLLNSIDLAPTLLELCGGQVPASTQAVVDGRSFAPLLGGGQLEERPVLIEMGYGRALISGGWKYIAVRYPDEILEEMQRQQKMADLSGRVGHFTNERFSKRWPGYGQADQLYDLKADPMEKNNLVGDSSYAAKLAEMKELLRECLQPLPHVFGEFKTHSN